LNANHKIVDKKEILRVRTVPNTGMYCSSDWVCTVYNNCSKIPQIDMLQTVAQQGGREGQYWAPKPNHYTVKYSPGPARQGCCYNHCHRSKKLRSVIFISRPFNSINESQNIRFLDYFESGEVQSQALMQYCNINIFLWRNNPTCA
jgi:hypothetical protein